MLQLDVLVNRRPIKKYFDERGRTWVEGREGSRFSLRIKNDTMHKISAVVSVDGINIINGKHAPAKESPGYIIYPWSKVEIPGWKISREKVKEFYFSYRKNSYSRKIGADESNIGIIGVAAFTLKEQWPCFYSSSATYTPPGYWYSCDSSSTVPLTATADAVSENTTYINHMYSTEIAVGSGKEAKFKTEKVDYEKEVLLTYVKLFYDTYQGLKRRGIIRHTRMYQKEPIAFPDVDEYCPKV